MTALHSTPFQVTYSRHTHHRSDAPWPNGHGCSTLHQKTNYYLESMSLFNTMSWKFYLFATISTIYLILFCFVLSHNYPPVALASVIHLTQCIHASLEIVICYSCCFPFIVQQDQYLSVFASCLRPLEEPIDCLSCRALIHFLHVMSVCFVSL